MWVCADAAGPKSERTENDICVGINDKNLGPLARAATNLVATHDHTIETAQP